LQSIYATRPPLKGFHSNPEILHLAVMMYVRFPVSLRNVEDLLHERGIDISHETVRYWPIRFGPMFAAEIRRKNVSSKCVRTRIGDGTWPRFS
jgi:putative transposase